MTPIAQLIAAHKGALAEVREMDGPDGRDFDAAVAAESAALKRSPGPDAEA